MKLPAYFSPLILIALISFTTGCLSWEAGWKTVPASSGKGDVNMLIEKAKKLIDDADSREKIQKIIDTCEDALKIDPNNLTAIEGAGTAYYIMGYCYNDTVSDKKASYIKAVQYAERHMYANPEFKTLVDKGEPVWEACRALGKNEMNAMTVWYQALGSYWTECMGPIAKAVNFYWTGRANKVLQRMTDVAPDWLSGNAYFCWAAYYSIAPGILGGDMKKAEENFNKSLELGPRMTNVYTGRALYYRTKMNDRKGFIEDLEKAIAIDPHHADSLIYPWAIWHQRKAKEMIKDVDKYFK